MSNLVFNIPLPPNGAFCISPDTVLTKTPRFSTIVTDSASLRGQSRISLSPFPVWNIQWDLAYLTGSETTANSAYQSVLGFYMQMKGSADDFLISMPGDNAITTPAFFGQGDGATASFQVTRPIAGGLDIMQNFDGSPTLYMNGVSIVPRNLVPDSDGTGLTWVGDGLLIFSSTGGAVTGGKWTYTGTGAASAFRIQQTPIFNLVPGATYTLSGYIDASHVTTSGCAWLVMDPTLSTTYAFAPQTPGVNGRVTLTFTLPAGSGVTPVRVLSDTDNSVVTTGQPLVFSNPQVELGSVATAYQSFNQTNYSISNTGVVTFLNPPALGTLLSWTGNFYYRVHFVDDSLQLQYIGRNIWQIQTLKLESVILPA